MVEATLNTMAIEGPTQGYLAAFEKIEALGAGAANAWLLPIRKAAMARFAELGFPTTRDEEWRFTNVSRIADGTPLSTNEFEVSGTSKSRAQPEDSE